MAVFTRLNRHALSTRKVVNGVASVSKARNSYSNYHLQSENMKIFNQDIEFYDNLHPVGKKFRVASIVSRKNKESMGSKFNQPLEHWIVEKVFYLSVLTVQPADSPFFQDQLYIYIDPLYF